MSKPAPKPTQKSPLEVFNQITRFIDLTTYPIGLEFLNDDYRISIRTKLMIFVIGFYFFNAAYTIWYLSDDILAVLEVLCMNGLAVPVRPYQINKN